MLQPKKTKFRRAQKGRAKGVAQRGNQLTFGSFRSSSCCCYSLYATSRTSLGSYFP